MANSSLSSVSVSEQDQIATIGSPQTPGASGQQGLTNFDESSRELQIAAPVSIPRPISDPYSTPTPSQLIGKMYNIQNFTWVPGWAGATLCFPYQLLNNVQTFVKVFSRYRFLRADIVVEIKLNTTPFHQGALIIGWLPTAGSNALPVPVTTIVSDTFLLSSLNGIVLSAATQDSVKFKIPYLMPTDWLDLIQQPTTSSDGRIATVYIRELNTLTATSANIGTSIPVMVFAGFENIHVAGYVSNMDEPKSESHAKALKGLDAKSTVSAVSQVIRKIPIIGQGYGVVADLVNSFAGDLSKPVNNASSTPIHNVYLKESALSHANTYAEQLSLYPNADIAQAPEFCGMKTSHMSVSELAQQPMLVGQQTFTSSVTSCTMKATPLITAVSSTSGSTSTSIGDWLFNMALPFVYWRGSIKYSLHFCVPSFYSFRVRVAITQQTAALVDPGDIPSHVIDIKGDTWFDFTVPYLYPTMWRCPFNDHAAAASTVPIVTISILTAVVGSSAPSAPVIYMNIFRSGGPDTSFSQLRGVRPGSAPFAVSNVSIAERFSKGFPGLVENVAGGSEVGFCMPEVVKTVSDCIKRPSSFLLSSTSTQPWSFPAGTANVNYNTIAGEPYNYFSAFFRYWRGSRVLRHYQPCNLVALANDGVSVTFGDGAAAMFTTATNALYNQESVSIPYYSQIPYQPNRLAPGAFGTFAAAIFSDSLYSYNLSEQFGVPNSQTNLSLQAGDDFMLMYPVPFFPVYFSPIYFGPGLPALARPDVYPPLPPPHSRPVVSAFPLSN